VTKWCEYVFDIYVSVSILIMMMMMMMMMIEHLYTAQIKQ
jgi:hypothetical protein